VSRERSLNWAWTRITGRIVLKELAPGYWRVVGEVDELIDKAKEMAQRTLFGTGSARILSKI
jgi:hypothetical protein